MRRSAGDVFVLFYKLAVYATFVVGGGVTWFFLAPVFGLAFQWLLVGGVILFAPFNAVLAWAWIGGLKAPSSPTVRGEVLHSLILTAPAAALPCVSAFAWAVWAGVSAFDGLLLVPFPLAASLSTGCFFFFAVLAFRLRKREEGENLPLATSDPSP